MASLQIISWQKNHVFSVAWAKEGVQTHSCQCGFCKACRLLVAEGRSFLRLVEKLPGRFGHFLVPLGFVLGKVRVTWCPN